MRLSKEQLNLIKSKYNVSELWSFSKFDSYRTSHYEWFLKYVLNKKEDNKKPSAYGIVGGVVHDLIENMYDGKIKRENLLDMFDNEWMINIGTLDLYFDRNDSDKNSNIRSKYYENIKLFCRDYNMLNYKMINEQFVSIKVFDDIVFQGYVDAIYKNEDGIVTIVDYKTSTKYSGKAIDEHAGQLLLYAEGLRQLGIDKDRIRICWNFLKYCEFKFKQKNGKEKSRIIERRILGDKIKNTVVGWLNDAGYSSRDIDAYIEKLLFTNDVNILPEDIKDNFILDDCYVYVDDIWNKYDELKNEIYETISEIKSKIEDYNMFKDEEIFYDNRNNLEKNSYYYSNLCGYSINTMKPYKQYLEDINVFNNSDDDNNKKDNNDDLDLLSMLDII